jgi:hypothetical protein
MFIFDIFITYGKQVGIKKLFLDIFRFYKIFSDNTVFKWLLM